MRVERSLDPVHQLPIRTRRSENLLLPGERLRRLFQDRVTSCLTSRRTEVSPQLITQIGRRGSNPAATEIDQHGSALRQITSMRDESPDRIQRQIGT